MKIYTLNKNELWKALKQKLYTKSQWIYIELLEKPKHFKDMQKETNVSQSEMCKKVSLAASACPILR